MCADVCMHEIVQICVCTGGICVHIYVSDYWLYKGVASVCMHICVGVFICLSVCVHEFIHTNCVCMYARFFCVYRRKLRLVSSVIYSGISFKYNSYNCRSSYTANYWFYNDMQNLANMWCKECVNYINDGNYVKHEHF